MQTGPELTCQSPTLRRRAQHTTGLTDDAEGLVRGESLPGPAPVGGGEAPARRSRERVPGGPSRDGSTLGAEPCDLWPDEKNVVDASTTAFSGFAK
ncbi:hypothetical protein ON010_g17383 [Phytophthora cinnamomi]|nr:hypothetical protein ON010_g17383 [Phytophthora cinnamomi]